jgi:8-oxo-dGTP diphosphatase
MVKMVNQRISAGGIVVVDNKVLMVHHFLENQYDFWVLPGGGIEENEGIFRAVERELLEETNLKVKSERIAYIEEFMDEGKYVCKFWVYCSLVQGKLSTEHKCTDEGFLQDAKFFSEEELCGMNAFPEIVRNDLWKDLADGFSKIKYLGYKQNEK